MGILHVTGSAGPRDCSSAVAHGKCVLLFRPERLLGSHRLAAPGTAVARVGAKPGWPLTHFPALGRVSSLSCVRSLRWLCLKPHRSESDQRSKSAKDGAGAQAAIAEQQSHGPAPAVWLPERDRVCELGVRTIALGMGLLGTAAGEGWRKQGPGRCGRVSQHTALIQGLHKESGSNCCLLRP